jgi:hypothetical protein
MKTLEIHNSDRVNYRRCRRKWNFQSGLRENLVVRGEASTPLWLGSGFHFALEDFHGYNHFGDPRRAFDAYVEATTGSHPHDVDEAVLVGDGMLAYYVELWLPKHPVYPTLIIDGKPQVEVDIEIPITDHLPDWLVDKLRNQYDDDVEVVVKQTFDKVEQEPEYGVIYGVDYKTAKQMADIATLSMNPQASQYYWAMTWFYDGESDGIVWQQHLKKIPTPPEPLKTGGLSMAKSQTTTYAMYRRGLIDMFGHVPKGYADILNHLASQEDENGDRFVRREILRRNKHHGEVEFQKLIAEATEMLDPDLPIYPNPTRDCTWDCPFRDVSMAMDSGEDWEYMLESEYVQHQGYDDSWRKRIVWPAEVTA